MRNFSNFLLAAGLTFLSFGTASAQDYPLHLADPNQDFDEYPTAIATLANKVTATVGIHEEYFEISDLWQNPYYGIPCYSCGVESVFVTWREEGNASTWNANIFIDGYLNNHVGAQSAPQIDINNNGEVYVSFSYGEIAVVRDAAGNYITFSTGGGNNHKHDLAVVKFDAQGNYIWHITEGYRSNDYITDLDYNDATGLLAIGGYVEGDHVLPFAGGAAVVSGLTYPSTLGPNYPFGNAFAAVYEDNGSSASFLWAREVKAPTYSTDVVMDDNRNVFLSGFFYETKWLAGAPLSSQYSPGGWIYQYFIVAFDGNSSTLWAEAYGSKDNELDVATDKHLRHSSLAINPNTSDLFHAFNNTGNSGGPFPYFGTYVNYIDAGSGAVQASISVGAIGNANGSNYASDQGSPTYNPNIDVNVKGQVFLSGNFLLSATGSSDIGIAFEEMEIGGTYLNHGMTRAGSNGYDQAVGWYSTIVDFGSNNVYNENLNSSYLPVNPNNVVNQIPVYGTAEAYQGYIFYSALGFKFGELELDLSANIGVVNYYENLSNGTPQYDGLIVRTDMGNGQHVKPNAPTTAQGAASQDPSSFGQLGDGSTGTWTASPNPVSAGQSLFWKSTLSTEIVDYIRLVDMTGRTVQEWNQPKAGNQGFQLAIGKLVTGTYLLEATGKDLQQSTLIVVK